MNFDQAERQYEREQEAKREAYEVSHENALQAFNDQLETLLDDADWLDESVQQTIMENDKHNDIQRQQLELIMRSFRNGDFNDVDTREALVRFGSMVVIDAMNYLSESAADNTHISGFKALKFELKA